MGEHRDREDREGGRSSRRERDETGRRFGVHSKNYLLNLYIYLLVVHPP